MLAAYAQQPPARRLAGGVCRRWFWPFRAAADAPEQPPPPPPPTVDQLRKGVAVARRRIRAVESENASAQLRLGELTRMARAAEAEAAAAEARAASLRAALQRDAIRLVDHTGAPFEVAHVGAEGTRLSAVLRDLQLSPPTAGAWWLGAVRLQEVQHGASEYAAPVAPPPALESALLAAAGSPPGGRVPWLCRLRPGARVQLAPTRPGEAPAFDMAAIRLSKPFAPWLHGEMRSNHAGETGAVSIYCGARWALGVRRALLGEAGAASPELAALAEQIEEHEASEREHLGFFNVVLAPHERSVLIPGWRVAGWLLGAVSTLMGPRRMYQTTDAVESFVEEHYTAQVRRLKLEADPAVDPEVCRLLEHCCAEEVHHREEAAARVAAAEGWFMPRFDAAWRKLVFVGSEYAAALAKRV